MRNQSHAKKKIENRKKENLAYLSLNHKSSLLYLNKAIKMEANISWNYMENHVDMLKKFNSQKFISRSELLLLMPHMLQNNTYEYIHKVLAHIE